VSSTTEAELRAHFGPAGLRRPTGVPMGLPVQVAPYFTVAPEDGAASVLGTDRGGRLRLGAAGSVENDRAAISLPDQFVSSSLDAFAEGLLELDRALPVIVGSSTPGPALDGYRELRRSLLALDPSAFADRESWWPQVLDDIRHPLTIGSSAAIEFRDQAGDKQILTATTAPGRPHPEELLRYRLQAAGLPVDAVTRVYCELEPCLLPGHYCAVWMAGTFPRATFTHSFDYGEDARSREHGIRELLLHAARQHGQSAEEPSG
jgi:Xanthomonas XOO_2897-like deaminase/SUKH-4 immunity protein